jgi:hypothetical protein
MTIFLYRLDAFSVNVGTSLGWRVVGVGTIYVCVREIVKRGEAQDYGA